MISSMFETTRLSIREVHEEDMPAIYELHRLQEVDEYNTYGIPQSRQQMDEEVKLWLAHRYMQTRTSYVMGITLKDNGGFIGLIAMNLGPAKYKNAEVWYKLFPAFWNRGYATEALVGLLHIAFTTLGLHRIEAGCATENTGSVRVLEKAGMQREGRKRSALPIRGQWLDCYEYAILKTDFIANS